MAEPPDGCPAILIGLRIHRIIHANSLNSAPSCCVPLLIKHAERGMQKDNFVARHLAWGQAIKPLFPTRLAQRQVGKTVPLGQLGATLLIAWL